MIRATEWPEVLQLWRMDRSLACYPRCQSVTHNPCAEGAGECEPLWLAGRPQRCDWCDYTHDCEPCA